MQSSGRGGRPSAQSFAALSAGVGGLRRKVVPVIRSDAHTGEVDLQKGWSFLTSRVSMCSTETTYPITSDRRLSFVVGYGTTPATPVHGITIVGISFARSWFAIQDDGMKLRAFSSPQCRQPTARNQRSTKRKCRSLWHRWLPTSGRHMRTL